MSISAQQRQLLGLAVAVSRQRNGEPLARIAKPQPGFRIPVVVDCWPDLTAPIAAHVLGGVALRPTNDRAGVLRLERTPRALATRGRMARAITSLVANGLLTFRPALLRDRVRQQGSGYGYVLTESGLTIGLQNEIVVPELARRLWLLQDDPGLAPEGLPVPPFMPPPDAVTLRA